MMTTQLQKAFQYLVPFLILGFVIAALIGLVILFARLFVWGLLIGLILWLGYLIKEFFSPSPEEEGQKTGRIIEHDKKD